MPRGHISLIVGVAGFGKSTLTARFIADISTGKASGKPENCLVSATEDHVGAVTVPRLKAAHANLANVFPERSWHFPRDLEEFESVIKDRDISAVFLDPLDDAVDNIGSQEGRKTLGLLSALAEEHNVAIVAVHHFTKTGKTIDRAIGGGRGVQGVSRSIMIFGPEPGEKLSIEADDQERAAHEARENHLVLAHWKCNLGPLQTSLVYERSTVPHPVDQLQTVPVLNHVGESELSAEEVFAYGGGKRAASEGTRENCKNLILSLLADSPKGPTDLETAAKASGFGHNVFKKARHELADEGQIEYVEFPQNVWRVKVPDKPPSDWK